MKIRTLVSMLSLTLAFVAPSFAEDGSKHTPLEDQMSIMNKSTKGMRKLEGDFTKGEQLAKEALEAAKKSRDLVPMKVEKMTDAAAKAAAIESYKKQIDELIAGFDAVVAACAAKDEAKFKEAYDALGQMKKKGHGEFMEEDDE